jgi:molybdate transport system substrate-binding protein
MSTPLLRRRILASLASIGILLVARPTRAQAAPTVAAASDLKFALEEVAARFEKDRGHKLRLVFGSSGNFHSQLLQGAPFQMFMSADESYVLKLADAGKTIDRGRLYALGRIGIIVPNGSPLKPDGELVDLAAALKDGRLRKFAIANPEHAPYGARAREALQRAGLWEAIQPRLVLGENISQTAQFATSGSAQGGIIALSLARAPSLAALGRFALIPEGWHAPLKQRMVLMRDAPAPLRAFYDHLGTPAAQEVMMRYGFTMPKD